MPNLSLRVCMYIYEIHVHTNVRTYVRIHSLYNIYSSIVCLLFVYTGMAGVYVYLANYAGPQVQSERLVLDLERGNY